jgi:lipopolysaccharide/colanic/teichoic acid biosynthesis glycosyltransferase
MHILYIHQYFDTPRGAWGTRSYEMAGALLRAGHTVTMVCASADRSETGVAGPFVRGMRSGTVDGINVIEIDLAYANGDSLLARASKFARYAIAASRIALTCDYDLIFASSTPLTVAVPGILARFLRRKPFVFEVRDLWPALPKAMGMRNPAALLGMAALERAAYRNADAIVALAPGIADGVARTGYLRERIAIIPNGCDLDLFGKGEVIRPSTLRPDVFGHDDFVAVFAGAHGRANGLDALLPVAELLAVRGRSDIRLLLVGEGATKAFLREEAARRGLGGLIFMDPMPKHKLAKLIRGCDLGLQLLADIPAFYDGTSPNKFFDYLAAGRPVLINYPGWLARAVRDADCGWTVPPDDPGAFVDALIDAADHREVLAARGQRASLLARTDYDREHLAAKLCAIVEAVQDHARLRGGLSYAKRMFDVVAALTAMLLLSPFLLSISLCLLCLQGRPIIFRQIRPGLAGRPFVLRKFRTMKVPTASSSGQRDNDADRLTPIGRLLRSTSLDELPELWNILKGEMSFVGPRPLLMQYLTRYRGDQLNRHNLLPGLTGWAQVNGRNQISWDEKFALDLWYVRNRSMVLDLRILLLTIVKVVRREAVSGKDHPTAREFDPASEQTR